MYYRPFPGTVKLRECSLIALFISATLEQVEQPVLAPARVVARAGRDGGDGLADRDNLRNKACKNICKVQKYIPSPAPAARTGSACWGPSWPDTATRRSEGDWVGDRVS